MPWSVDTPFSEASFTSTSGPPEPLHGIGPRTRFIALRAATDVTSSSSPPRTGEELRDGLACCPSSSPIGTLSARGLSNVEEMSLCTLQVRPKSDRHNSPLTTSDLPATPAGHVSSFRYPPRLTLAWATGSTVTSPVSTGERFDLCKAGCATRAPRVVPVGSTSDPLPD